MSLGTQLSGSRLHGRKVRAGSSVIAALVLTVASLSGIGAASASAATPSTSSLAVVSSVTHTNAACLTAVKNAAAQGNTSVSASVCTTTVTLSATAPKVLSTADVSSLKSSLSTSDYKSLVVAAAAGTVHYKSYSQQENNTTDSETQYGTFYYDGASAWVTISYRGFKGTHTCKLDWAVGYVIELKACNEDGGISQRNLNAHWHFTAWPSGGFVNWDEIYTVHVNSVGRIWQ